MSKHSDDCAGRNGAYGGVGAEYYGTKLHPEQVPLGGPDKYGFYTYVEPSDPRLASAIAKAEGRS